MIYLANPCSPEVIASMASGLLGMIDTPYQHKVTRVREAHAARVSWCADNGAFTARWDETTWWAWLTADLQQENRDRCLFATAPDVVADAAATWERSRPWLPRIREAGYPVAYVAQDGLTDLPWGDFDVLFLGGTTAFKIGSEARDWTAQAVARGVPVHMGRVNSGRRYDYARAIGCSSADGTFLTFGPDTNLPRVHRWFGSLDQGSLF